MKIIHCIADCTHPGCGKRWEGVDELENARNHAKRTGHPVCWEKAYGGVWRMEGYINIPFKGDDK